MNDNKLILIVDDNPENLKVLGSILKLNGLSPAFAKNGMKALSSVKNRRPDLILLDIMMPEMDGFEVCRQLKQDSVSQEIPIIFLTAKTEKQDVIQGLELGAVDYVTKPFNSKELMTRVNTHLELKAAKEKLRQAVATKDKFFSIIAHDLANIFNTSLGSSSLLTGVQEQLDDEERKEFLLLIHHSLEKGYNLLKNLLEWSRSQTGRIQVTLATLQLKNMVDQNISLLKNNAKAKNITLFSSVDNLSVVADEKMLDTVIRNLLSNAIKFTPKGGKVDISATKVQENVVEISISDTGVGIEPENLDNLFRIDVSVSTRGTAKEEGTGLGLILCKEFVEKNGGTIGVESEPKKGSRFYVRLPSP
jgi:two-component system sensor histidine kinase/response regulator